ncbi:molybdate ABC transporter substrate-binding protein [Parasedimentitalea psychrophila]|uniref:Molybdate ABC transporter substrate-binding protein n=1 Tax=Parasedimentitalea psychrophila TaxID=2997337 RepID=A0A9Y2P3I4_9RHOB|nr:molybdate ABC transporter substrate-binding protein [Parasedimentitalea psychrophila]WIY24314.1 molybdate ABC transporter substrate-binding protein [Parasedimentitalea psychrophila]
MTMPCPFRRLTSALAVCAALFPVALFPGALAAEEVTLFAAASLKSALDELSDDYPGATLHIAYGGSSSLTRQILQGAPAQLFISANQAWMDRLERDRVLAQDSRIDLLSNRLALIAAPGSTVQLPPARGFDLAAAIGDGVLAMALVKAVPAGIYGREALQALGVWDSVQGKIAQADNVRAALRLVATGEAPLGIVYASDLGASPDVRLLGLFPANSHRPIRYPMALIDPVTPEARSVYDFLSSEAAWAVFAKHGFIRPQVQP